MVVLEEADESLHWLEFIRDCSLAASDDLRPLITEASQLVAIFAASVQTAKRHEPLYRRR